MTIKTLDLTNHLLVAMPTLTDPLFSKSVIYVTDHDAQGATGFIINKPVDMCLRDVLERISLTTSDKSLETLPMLLGGPVRADQVFVATPDHTPSLMLPSLKLSSSREVLESIMASGIKKDFMMLIGYADWSAGQLESEIKNNSWLVVPANTELLYHVPYNRRYGTAMALMGVDINQLSLEVGHA